MKLLKCNVLSFLFLIIGNLFSNNNFDFYPIMFSTYKSAGGDWHYEDKYISINGIGIVAKSILNRWSIDSRYIQLGLLGNINHELMNFSPTQSFPYIDGSKDADGFWTEIATMKVSYNLDPVKFEFGKFDRQWGPGIRSLHISNKTPSYPQFGFEWKINQNLKLIYFHGLLKSNIPDTSRIGYYNNQVSNRSFNLSRSLATHRIEWQPSKKIKLSANESVIYGTRGIDFHYLLPFIPFYQIENYLGDTDNVQMGCDIIYKINPMLQLYLSFYMDELTPEWLLKKINHNWFAWQFGFSWKNLLSGSDQLTFEYNWTDHRIYKHKFPINDYYSHGQPLGYWAGPHAEELLINYQYIFNNNQIFITMSNVKRGALTNEMIYNKYHDIQDFRFSNKLGFEQKSLLELILRKETKINGLSIQLGFDWIHWMNAGFNIFQPDSIAVTDISKLSVNTAILYNFNSY
tara:strand:+ start:10085 stop:11461 length:1377 start_codon:yes stop_codon:yes gene_type:complete